MSRKPQFVTKKPVVLEGYQALLRPSKFGHKIEAIIEDEDLIAALDAKYAELNAQSLKNPKIKNPRRASAKPTPWEEVSAGRFKISFKWDEDSKPTIVDSQGVPIRDNSLRVYSGSTVRVAFDLRPYILKDGVTYGVKVVPSAIQVVSIASSYAPAALDEEEASELFGVVDGGFSVEDYEPTDEPEPASDTPIDDSDEELEF